MPPVPSADLEEGLVHPPLHQHPPWTPITSDPTAKQVIRARPRSGRGQAVEGCQTATTNDNRTVTLPLLSELHTAFTAGQHKRVTHLRRLTTEEL